MKIIVQRIRLRGLFGAARLGGDQLGVQRPRQTRDDFVLHVEEITERFVESLGPEVIARFCVDELDVDSHAASATLNAALERVADVQLALDRLHVERLAFVGERRVAGDSTSPKLTDAQLVMMRAPADRAWVGRRSRCRRLAAVTPVCATNSFMDAASSPFLQKHETAASRTTASSKFLGLAIASPVARWREHLATNAMGLHFRMLVLKRRKPRVDAAMEKAG